MNHKYDNSERLETVSDKQWREALDELTTYLRWCLRGKIEQMESDSIVVTVGKSKKKVEAKE